MRKGSRSRKALLRGNSLVQSTFFNLISLLDASKRDDTLLIEFFSQSRVYVMTENKLLHEKYITFMRTISSRHGIIWKDEGGLSTSISLFYQNALFLIMLSVS